MLVHTHSCHAPMRRHASTAYIEFYCAPVAGIEPCFALTKHCRVREEEAKREYSKVEERIYFEKKRGLGATTAILVANMATPPAALFSRVKGFKPAFAHIKTTPKKQKKTVSSL